MPIKRNSVLLFPDTHASEHMPQPAYDNLCGLQVESDEARRH
jgi:hypothetical protein